MLTKIGLHTSNPQVCASLISRKPDECGSSEFDVYTSEAMNQNQNQPYSKASAVILNGKARLEKTNDHFQSNLRNMQVTKLKRAETRGAGNVTDEKFALLFQTTLHAGDIHLNVGYLAI